MNMDKDWMERIWVWEMAYMQRRRSRITSSSWTGCEKLHCIGIWRRIN